MANNICKDHSGCITLLESHTKDIKELWKTVRKIEARMDQIFGAVIITLLAALANLIIKIK